MPNLIWGIPCLIWGMSKNHAKHHLGYTMPHLGYEHKPREHHRDGATSRRPKQPQTTRTSSRRRDIEASETATNHANIIETARHRGVRNSHKPREHHRDGATSRRPKQPQTTPHVTRSRDIEAYFTCFVSTGYTMITVAITLHWATYIDRQTFYEVSHYEETCSLSTAQT